MSDFGKVTQQHDRIAIVASGPSLTGFDFSLLDGLTVIGVNSAAFAIPRCDYFFTLDPNNENHAVAFRAAYELPNSYIAFYKIMPDFDRRAVWLRAINGDGWMGSHMGLRHDPAEIANGNSAHGALNLAMHMRPKAVALLGVDATHDGYFYGEGASTYLHHLPELFAAELPPFPVFNGSPQSRVDCFPRMTPGEAIESLRRVTC